MSQRAHGTSLPTLALHMPNTAGLPEAVRRFFSGEKYVNLQDDGHPFDSGFAQGLIVSKRFAELIDPAKRLYNALEAVEKLMLENQEAYPTMLMEVIELRSVDLWSVDSFARAWDGMDIAVPETVSEREKAVRDRSMAFGDVGRAFDSIRDSTKTVRLLLGMVESGSIPITDATEFTEAASAFLELVSKLDTLWTPTFDHASIQYRWRKQTADGKTQFWPAVQKQMRPTWHGRALS